MPQMPPRRTKKTEILGPKTDIYDGKAKIHGHCILRVELDKEGQPVDCTYIHANEELARLDKKPLDQLIGHTFFEVFPDGEHKWLQFFYEAAYEGKSVAVDKISEELGLYLHLEAYPVGRVGYCSCIVCDIKESVASKLREKAMQKVAEHASVIDALSTIYTTIIEADLVTHGFKIIQTNSPFTTVTGGKSQGNFDEVMEDVLKFYMQPDDIDRMREFIDLSTVSERMGEETSLVTEYRSPYGKWFEARFIAKNRDEGGNVVSAIYAARDVTSEKLKELHYREQLQAIAQEAEKANKAKTEFLLRMSHDIRTPLNGIRGMLDIADHYGNDIEKVKECRRKVRESSNILLELINEVLDMSKLESGEVTLEHIPFDLVNISYEVFTVIDKQAEERGIEIIEESQIQHTRLIGSPVHFKRLLLNILGNAIKYNKPHGKVYVTCREVSFDGKTIVLETVIRDTGIGMSESFQEHLFEPFQQENASARTKYGGTGLGMSITKSLVEKMNGSITFESKKDVGTTFIVQIPFEVNFDEHPEELEASGEDFSISDKTLLLVEDNDINLEIAQFILSETGAHIIVAHNGQEAVDAFSASSPGEIAAILMDLMMPVMDGYEATRHIRAMDREDATLVPIIAMTANAFVEDKIATRKAGMNAHLAKPLDAKQVIRIICDQLKER
jgi:signal transduction histidine kinase/ActR/RegA family two-component response regulator